jgi:hypothetical protein
MNARSNLLIGVAAAAGLLVSGCWRQQSLHNAAADQVLFQSLPVGSEYPGTRELMNAPSNDPALKESRSGNSTRP